MPERYQDHGSVIPAAFMSRSTSRSVRYSRVRHSLFGSQPGRTVLFTVVGPLERRLDFIDDFPCARSSLFLIIGIVRTVLMAQTMRTAAAFW
jgi:hypothetical protein